MMEILKSFEARSCQDIITMENSSMPTSLREEIPTEVNPHRSMRHYQYLTFIVGEGHYGVDILNVQEIKRYSTVTCLPNMPEYMKGIINLRGTIVPIIDLRMKFGMGITEAASHMVIIVLKVHHQIIGCLVDAVSDVLDVDSQDIQKPPELGNQIATTFIAGIACSNDLLVTLLRMDEVCIDPIVAPSAEPEIITTLEGMREDQSGLF